ncbi:MAG: hypothetical protein V5A85_14390 [Haloarculaceae archaeon]
MDRRALLTASLAALAGCLPLRGDPATPRRNVNHPRMHAEIAWLPEESAYRVRMLAGNRFTAENTRSVRVVVDADRYRRVSWVGGEDPAQAFPLDVGDELVVPTGSPGTLRIVWTAPDGDRSVALESREDTPTPGPTRTPRPPASATPTATEERV